MPRKRRQRYSPASSSIYTTREKSSDPTHLCGRTDAGIGDISIRKGPCTQGNERERWNSQELFICINSTDGRAVCISVSYVLCVVAWDIRRFPLYCKLISTSCIMMYVGRCMSRTSISFEAFHHGAITRFLCSSIVCRIELGEESCMRREGRGYEGFVYRRPWGRNKSRPSRPAQRRVRPLYLVWWRNWMRVLVRKG